MVREVQLESVKREKETRRTIQEEQEYDDQTEVEVIKKDKIIEIIKEVPKRIERRVDVEKEIIVDIPIERYYETE